MLTVKEAFSLGDIAFTRGDRILDPAQIRAALAEAPAHVVKTAVAPPTEAAPMPVPAENDDAPHDE